MDSKGELMDYQSYETYQNQANTVRKNPFSKASLIMGVFALLTIATGVLPMLFGLDARAWHHGFLDTA